MKQTEAIDKLLKDNNKNKSYLGEALGYSSTASVAMMYKRGAITVKTLLRICDIFGYELTIQPKRRAGARPAGQIVIDS